MVNYSTFQCQSSSPSLNPKFSRTNLVLWFWSFFAPWNHHLTLTRRPSYSRHRRRGRGRHLQQRHVLVPADAKRRPRQEGEEAEEPGDVWGWGDGSGEVIHKKGEVPEIEVPPNYPSNDGSFNYKPSILIHFGYLHLWKPPMGRGSDEKWYTIELLRRFRTPGMGWGKFPTYGIWLEALCQPPTRLWD